MRTTWASWGARLARMAFLGLMVVGVWLMASASTAYLDLGDAHPFFLEKLPLARPRLWLVALYVHVPSALLALPACLVLLTKRVRTRLPRVHRWLGRTTGVVVLLGVVPSGLYLALFAQGGLITTFGFWLTGLIALFAMVGSIVSARARNMRAHRRYSTHVAAQLSVAVFSRLLLVGAEEAGLYAGWVYVAALWVPVVGSALAAELLTGSMRISTAKGARHDETLVAVSHLDAVR